MRGTGRTSPEGQIEVVLDRVEQLERRVDRLRNNTTPTLPFYDHTNWPAFSVEGQIALDHNSGAAYRYFDGSWGAIGGAAVQHNDTPVASEPSLNFYDSSTVIFIVNDDPTNNRVFIQANSIVPAGIRYDYENDGNFLRITAHNPLHFPSAGWPDSIMIQDTSPGVDNYGGIRIMSAEHGVLFDGTEVDIQARRIMGYSPITTGTYAIGGQVFIGARNLIGPSYAGIVMLLESGTPSSIFGGTDHLILYGNDGGPTTGLNTFSEILLAVYRTPGGATTYHIKSGASWVADL